MMIQKLSLLMLSIWVKLQSFTTMYARGVLQISSDEEIESGQKSKPKIIPKASNKTQRNHWKINPQISKL